jgi:hypothetical protein
VSVMANDGSMVRTFGSDAQAVIVRVARATTIGKNHALRSRGVSGVEV